jgi:D-glycero-alpha-D-manno-heptose-7-phosphate kinase
MSKLNYFFFAPQTGLEMTTECTAPAGSGLARSSALNIAICGALNKFTGDRYNPETLIQIAKNVEAQVIDVLTGDQDFYPATYGRLEAIHLTAKGVGREAIPADLERLSGRLVLVFSGQQRNSGINNWEVMKHHIDGDEGIFRVCWGCSANFRSVENRSYFFADLKKVTDANSCHSRKLEIEQAD